MRVVLVDHILMHWNHEKVAQLRDKAASIDGTCFYNVTVIIFATSSRINSPRGAIKETSINN